MPLVYLALKEDAADLANYARNSGQLEVMESLDSLLQLLKRHYCGLKSYNDHCEAINGLCQNKDEEFASFSVWVRSLTNQ